jgi:hypothetical protein
MRVSAAGIYRLPTGQLDLPHDFTDAGTGDRQADLELQGFLDFAFGPRLWVSSVLRLGIQRPDQLVRRITNIAVNPFPELAREQEVGRDLGDVMELELAPRYVPNDEFAVSALYRYRSKGTDSYDGSFRSAPWTERRSLDASVLVSGPIRRNSPGFAVTYSTVRVIRNARRWLLKSRSSTPSVMSGETFRQQTNGIAFRFYRPTVGNASPWIRHSGLRPATQATASGDLAAGQSHPAAERSLGMRSTHFARRSPPNIRATSHGHPAGTTLMSAVDTTLHPWQPPRDGVRGPLPAPVRDHNHLGARQPPQAVADLQRNRTADASVDFVEHGVGTLVEARQDRLEREHNAESSPPDAVRRGRASAAHVQRHPEFDATAPAARWRPAVKVN